TERPREGARQAPPRDAPLAAARVRREDRGGDLSFRAVGWASAQRVTPSSGSSRWVTLAALVNPPYLLIHASTTPISSTRMVSSPICLNASTSGTGVTT